MKTFLEYIKEAEEFPTNKTNAKASVVNTIVSNFQRFTNSADEKDNGALLMLTAALAVLNVSDSSQAVQAAKRLSQMAATRAGKAKK